MINANTPTYYLLLDKIMRLAEKNKQVLYNNLDEQQKLEAYENIRFENSVPQELTIHEVADILGTSVQEVRKDCQDGKIIGYQTLPGSGKWLIETKQFMENENWNAFVKKRKEMN